MCVVDVVMSPFLSNEHIKCLVSVLHSCTQIGGGINRAHVSQQSGFEIVINKYDICFIQSMKCRNNFYILFFTNTIYIIHIDRLYSSSRGGSTVIWLGLRDYRREVHRFFFIF